MDIGLHRAGWRTVSFSEIDPYASAILAQRWPGVPNFGDIIRLTGREDGPSDSGRIGSDEGEVGVSSGIQHLDARTRGRPDGGGDGGSGDIRANSGLEADDRVWPDATLWTGGFPCQDLSVAGKRAGLAGERSGLALTFLDLVREHRPHALVLENVPGLLSSNSGRDLGVLLGRLGDAGYGWAFRVLDAQWFGVPQRRRRVFILALDAERYPDESSAAQVLAVGTRCERDHQAEREAWADTAGGTERSTFNASAKFGQWDGPDDAAGNLSARDYKSSNHLIVDGAPPDADRVREAAGMAGRVDGGQRVAATINSGGNSGGFRTEPGEHLVVSGPRAGTVSSPLPDDADGRRGESIDPEGLDSHRYRTIGNGVAAPVAEWIGRRLREYLTQ